MSIDRLLLPVLALCRYQSPTFFVIFGLSISHNNNFWLFGIFVCSVSVSLRSQLFRLFALLTLSPPLLRSAHDLVNDVVVSESLWLAPGTPIFPLVCLRHGQRLRVEQCGYRRRLGVTLTPRSRRSNSLLILVLLSTVWDLLSQTSPILNLGLMMLDFVTKLDLLLSTFGLFVPVSEERGRARIFLFLIAAALLHHQCWLLFTLLTH